MKPSALFCSLLLLVGCTHSPRGVEPVDDFSLERYLGRWYEIARLDHCFERGLSRVTADYSLRDDGGIDVLNQGYDASRGEWRQASGRAYPLQAGQGSLKVTFFWPFYAGYHVIELDKQDYGYALVSGPNRDYLWILSRAPSLDQAIVERLLARAKSLGYATEELIFVDQSAPPEPPNSQAGGRS